MGDRGRQLGWYGLEKLDNVQLELELGVARMLGHVKGIWDFRYFWMSLVKMDLMTRYRKSVLGIGWSLLYPVCMTAVFCVVFSTIFNQGGGWREYAQNTLAAMTFWEFIKGCLSQGCSSLTRSEAYIRQAPLPMSIYPLRTVLGNAFHLAMAAMVLLLLIAVLNPKGLTLTALLALPTFLLAFLFGWALATITAFATAFFHDVTHLVEVSMQVMFFLTPIIYDKSILKSYAWTCDYNPFALFIELFRSQLVQGEVGFARTYVASGLFTAAAVALAVGVVAWLQKKVIFHL